MKHDRCTVPRIAYLCGHRRENGQVMTEYVVVCLLVAILFIVPFEGKPLYAWVIDALRTMHKGYMAGVSVYAYPF